MEMTLEQTCTTILNRMTEGEITPEQARQDMVAAGMHPHFADEYILIEQGGSDRVEVE